MAVGFVRSARSADAAEIARIQLATWRVAYRRILPASVLAELDEAWMAQRWRVAVDAPPSPRHRVLVAVEQSGQDYLVGFVAAGPADEAALAPQEALAPAGEDGEDGGGAGLEPFGAGVVAITDLLVEPRWGRRGHGSRLLAAAVDHWRTDGFVTALAWAYQADVATQKFLAAAGWAADGATRALDVDDLLVPQLRLHADLSAE